MRSGAPRGGEEKRRSGTGGSPRPRGVGSAPGVSRGFPQAEPSLGGVCLCQERMWLALAAVLGAGGGKEDAPGLGWGQAGAVGSADPRQGHGAAERVRPPEPLLVPSTAVVRAFTCGCAF